MMKGVKLVFVVALANLLFSVYYLDMGFKVFRFYLEFEEKAPNAVIFNKYFLVFLIFSMLSFIFGICVKRRLKRGLEMGGKLYIAVLIFLSTPVIYFVFWWLRSLIVTSVALSKI